MEHGSRLYGCNLAACEAVGIKRLLKDLNEFIDKAKLVYCDNLNSIQLAWNPMFPAWTNHIEVQYHYIRAWIVAGAIDLRHVNTDV